MNKSKEDVNIVLQPDNKKDKSLILNRIIFHYKLKNKAALARFLGIATNTLSNWYTRNKINLKLVLTKCDELNPNWIINGIGNPDKNYINPEENGPTLVHEEEVMYLAKSRETEIERLQTIISAQEKTIAAQAKTIAVMELLIKTS